jgi:UDP-glucose 4-epimerase
VPERELANGRKLGRRAMNLEGRRVLVTGGAGFIGSHIIDLLAATDCREIIALDNMVRGRLRNLAASLGDPRVRLVRGDIRDRSLLNELVAGADVVFHQAALRITHCAAEPRAALEVMVDAPFDLLELCVQHRVQKVVAASSASIYGLAEAFPTSERHHPYGNRTLYGAAKSFLEGLLRSFHDMHGLDYVALRYFNVYGPRMDLHGRYTEVLVRWMKRIDADEPPMIFGDGYQTMDFVHVRDVARANLVAARMPVTDAVVNVGTGRETSLIDLARKLAQAMGRPHLRPEFLPERTVNPVPRRLADTAAARRELDFAAEVALEDGLRDLVDWWRANQAQPGADAVVHAAP